ncbi:hypothetical protein [Thermococcus thioreducens]|uniref:Uncharacterized protein n=1 Tax=Thermococcus thioreducens TaxID=277988 RepID=A0A0Q2UPF1_9EURY|nr:hypothetical protein [Thermococcus thioreducens]KQH82576.1 hypothetical protein AMR53_04675 [Thermococcus thioreducens]SEW15520.1 hypothetical protein SAMN05216170_1929 [Thermococcus thioreducens]
MKRVVTAVLVLLLLGMVVASGCLGGGGETSTTPSSPTTTPGTSTEATSPSSAPSPSAPSGTTPSPVTETQTTATETSSATETETQTPTEEAYWENPWEYAPINIKGETYWITYYKYRYKIQPDQNSQIYEYVIEKSVDKTTVNVCGMDIMGNKKDLGEQEAYAYRTVVNPIKAAGLDDTLTITVWYLSNMSDAFIYPWDVLWFSYMSPTGAGDNVFVGIQFDYKGRSFSVMNPAPFQSGLFPCFDGDMTLPDAVNEDLGYLYMGWVALVHLGFWYEWSNVNVLVPQSGVWSDGMGHTWTWSTSPDGVTSYSGFTFKLVNYQWKYEGTVEGVKLQGEGKFSPDLPLVIESEGYYSYKDPNTGQTTVVYGYLKLEDLKLDKNLP